MSKTLKRTKDTTSRAMRSRATRSRRSMRAERQGSVLFRRRVRDVFAARSVRDREDFSVTKNRWIRKKNKKKKKNENKNKNRELIFNIRGKRISFRVVFVDKSAVLLLHSWVFKSKRFIIESLPSQINIFVKHYLYPEYTYTYIHT